MALKLGTQDVVALYFGGAQVTSKYLGGNVVSGGLNLGPELVVNGGFDSDTVWTKGAGWTISGGILIKTATNTTGTVQTIPLVAGKKYQVVYQVLSISGATVSIRLNGTTNVSGTSRSVPGTYAQVLTANATSVGVTVAGTSSLAVTIDNISVREIL